MSGTGGSRSCLEPLVIGLSRNSKNTAGKKWGNEITGYNSTGDCNAGQRDFYRWEDQHFSGYTSAVRKSNFFTFPCSGSASRPKIVLNQNVGSLYSDSTAKKQRQAYPKPLSVWKSVGALSHWQKIPTRHQKNLSLSQYFVIVSIFLFHTQLTLKWPSTHILIKRGVYFPIQIKKKTS